MELADSAILIAELTESAVSQNVPDFLDGEEGTPPTHFSPAQGSENILYRLDRGVGDQINREGPTPMKLRV